MPGDPYAAPPAARPFLDEVGVDPGRLRIALDEESPNGAPVHADCRTAVRDTATLCERLGHHVETIPLPVDGRTLEEAFQVVYSAGASWRLDAWIRDLGRRPRENELEPTTWAFIEDGRRHSASDLLTAVELIQRAGRSIAALHERFDVTLSPTLAAPPVPLGHFNADDPVAADAALAADAAFAAFTWIANATGQPAMSVPLSWNSEGLPIGSQFTAAVGREDTLLRLAAQLEAAQPWADRWPEQVDS